MSVLKEPEPAKLIIGLFMKETEIFTDVFPLLEESFGGADMVGRWFDFDYTSYYEEEMGSPLFRRMVVFESMIPQYGLCDIKKTCSRLESRYEKDGKRTVNIDPGYLLASRFVLATGKDYSHRICIGEGVYADLTLIYKNRDYTPLEWTYPDYADRRMRDFLLKARAKYLLDRKQSGSEMEYD